MHNYWAYRDYLSQTAPLQTKGGKVMISDVVNFMTKLGFAMGEEEIKDGVVIYVVSKVVVVHAILYCWDGNYFYITFNKQTKKWKRSYN
jgi:hypothetical protein